MLHVVLNLLQCLNKLVMQNSVCNNNVPIAALTGPVPQYTGPVPQYTGPVPQYTGPVPKYTGPVPQFCSTHL
jgi:hypothetical protein